jgi:hypothetical protein
LEDVVIEGEGVIDGQAEYEWRLDDFERTFDHKTLMQNLGKPLLRTFPRGFPQREVFPHLIWLGNSKNIRVQGLKFLRSPSWAITLYACEQAVFKRLEVRSSLKEAVWSDGIDLDGCREVAITDCVIETGDDCVVFISTDVWGPAIPCENITVANCRLSSASAGVKFSEGNRAGIRDVQVRDCVLTNVNRGFVFSTTLGGSISNVMISDVRIHCNRFDWFWAGDGQPFHFRVTRLSEFNREPPKPDEPPPGSIRNVVISNVTAQAKGSSRMYGHRESWLEGIRLVNVKLSLSTDPAAPFDTADHALKIHCASNVTLSNVQVIWEKPSLKSWKSALVLDEVHRAEVDRFVGAAPGPEIQEPVMLFNQVAGAQIRHSTVAGDSPLFLKVTGADSRGIILRSNEYRSTTTAYRLDPGVRTNAVSLID